MATLGEPQDSVDPTGEFPLEPAIYFQHLSLVIARRRESRLELALRPLGLSLVAFRALRVVGRFGASTMGEIADYSLTDRTTLTRVIDDLVDAGLMLRSKPAGDRRKVVLELMPEARPLLRKAVAAVARELRGLMSDVPEARLRAAIRMQQELVARLADSESQLDRLLWRTRVDPEGPAGDN
jgi:DNA-binding MarR family transcriptional regulator